MGKYEAILFDLDDTLIDNDVSMKYAIYEIYKKLGIACCDDSFEKWKHFDSVYWADWENGTFVFPDWVNSQEKRIDFLRVNRFMAFFKNFNVSYEEAVKLNSYYISLLPKNVISIDGAYDVIKELSCNHELIISTNGDKKAAHAKIRAINIHPFIDKLVASGECGYSKPMPGFFKYVIDRMDTKNRSKMLIVGDSLKTDVLGGIYNGIDSCWFNPQQKENHLGMEPTYEIKHLRELIKKI